MGPDSTGTTVFATLNASLLLGDRSLAAHGFHGFHLRRGNRFVPPRDSTLWYVRTWIELPASAAARAARFRWHRTLQGATAPPRGAESTPCDSALATTLHHVKRLYGEGLDLP